jgi:EmrB/QacA subfamily drug resistance transporter
MTAVTVQPSFLGTRRGKLTLILLCSVGFLDFVDASIVNIALPAIRQDLHFSAQGLEWVPSGYLLTYGGFMLLGGRAADLLGRRRVLLAGIVVIGISSLIGGFAGSSGVLVGARLAQGLGAALTLPAALSLLTTSFRDGPERHKALGAWGAVAGLASAVGVLAGGLLTQGPGWRWVMFVNPLACVLLIGPVYRLIRRDQPRARSGGFDFLGSLLATAGLLLLVFALVKAPDQGWGAGRTIGELGGAAALLTVFAVNERFTRSPLLPFAIFRVRGLAAADVTQLVALAGFFSLFYFLTLYMQNVLHYSPIETGLAYVPLCFAIGLSSGIGAQLMSRVGTRPVIAAGLVIAGGGLYWLSRIPVHGHFASDMLPGLLIVALGFGAVFVGISTAANTGVRPQEAGLAAALLNTAQQVGGALGIAVLSAVSAARTNSLMTAGTPAPEALTAGFGRALLVGSFALLAAAVVAMWIANTRNPGTAGPSAGEPGRDSAASVTAPDAAETVP